MNSSRTEIRPGSRRRALPIGAALAVVLGVAGLLLRHRSPEPSGPPDVAQERTALQIRDGRFHLPETREPFSGWMLDRYPDGSVRLRSALIAGRLQGESVGWFTNGVMELREGFRDGLPHGLRATWHPNGQKRSEGQLQDGRQHGWHRQWDDAGRLVVQAEFAGGRPHGLSLAWHADGSLKAEALMAQGEVRTRHFYPAGERREPTLSSAASTSLVAAQLK